MLSTLRGRFMQSQFKCIAMFAVLVVFLSGCASHLAGVDNEPLARRDNEPLARGDNEPPTTTNDYDGMLHTESFTITLTGYDRDSGIASINYRLNDGAQKSVSRDGHPKIKTEGDNKLEYWSVDYFGNEEEHRMLSGIKFYRPTRIFAYTDVVFDVALSKVERPALAKERYGEQKITEVLEEGISKYCFEDEMARFLWVATTGRLVFVLENKTDHSIKIEWNEAAFVGTDGRSHRVMHSGVKYADRDKPQAPSVIVRKTTLEDTVIPSDNIYYADSIYVSGRDGGWRELPLFPVPGVSSLEVIAAAKSLNIRPSELALSELTSEELKKRAGMYIGKTIQVLLPLQIAGVVNDYIFTFEVKGVKVKEGTPIW